MKGRWFSLTLKRQWILSLFSILLLSTGTLLPSFGGKVLNDNLVTKPFGHHIWQEVLNRNITADGALHLVQLRAHPKRLNQYLEQLESVSPDSHPDYFPTQNHRLAYWINAHNAIALRLILDRYPVESLEQIPDLEQNTRYRIGGHPFSLLMLKRKIEFFNQPNAFLALTDFSISAPQILRAPYEGEKLEGQLQQQASRLMQAARYQGGEPKVGACISITLPSALKQYEVFFLKNETLKRSSDSDQILDTPLEELSSQQNNPSSNWGNVLFPYAPLEIRTSLRSGCTHTVLTEPDNKTLRLLTP